MRTVWLTLVLYLVIAFPFSNFEKAPIWALAKPGPQADETVGMAPADDEIAARSSRVSTPEMRQSVPEPARQNAAAPATPVSLTVAKLMDILRTLAGPAGKPTKAEMCETLVAAAFAHDLPVGFFVRLIQQESGFNPEVVSSAGAQGVAQFMPEVAKEWGLRDPFDPHQALPASARFLRSLRQQFGNWGLAAAAYNGGSGRVQKWLDKRGKLPKETQDYVKIITGIPAESWKGATRKVSFSIPAKAPCQEIAYLADPPEPVVMVAKERKEPADRKTGKEKAKLAEKSSGKSEGKSASAKGEKKPAGKSRVQVADVRSSRK